MATSTAANLAHAALQVELEEELRQAEEDLESGAFIDVTIDELDRCVAAGEWPWPDAFSV